MVTIQPTATPTTRPVVPPRDTEATRYLCAGAHLDERFAHRVVEELFVQRHRALGPSYGIEVVQILRHCFTARSRRLLRDLLLLLAVLWNLILNFPALVIAVVLVLVIRVIRRLRAGWQLNFNHLILLLLAVSALSALSSVVVQFLILANVAYWLYQLVDTTVVMVPSILLVMVAQVLLISLPVAVEQSAARRATRRLRADDFQRDGAPNVSERVQAKLEALEPRLQELGKAQDGNVTVYGRFEPFVGAGGIVEDWGWSLAVDLARPKKHLAVDVTSEPFGIEGVLEFVSARLKNRLVHDDARFQSTGSMPIKVERRAFVSGLRVAGTPLHPEPNTQPPSVWMDPDSIRDLINHPSAGRRYYLSIQVGLWGNEVVLTTFLHLDIKGSTLYAETVVCVLSPIRSVYHRADFAPADVSVSEQLGAGLAAVAATPVTAVRALQNIWQTLTTSRREERQRRTLLRSARDGRLVDYGARTSVRELGADDKFHDYLQKLDAVGAYQLTQRHVLDSLLEFLDAKGVDTEEFRASQTTILNNGVMLGQGSTIQNAGSLAVGAGAKASTVRARRGN